MSKRTDIHAPSRINPSDYDFIACDYFGGNALELMGFAHDRAMFKEHMQRTGGKFAEHHNSGDCHICGARCAYVARFHHTPSNTYITTGMDCAEKMEIGDPILFKAFRKRVREGLKTYKGKLAAQRILGEYGLERAWEVYQKPERKDGDRDTIRNEEATVFSIVCKLIKYGNISVPQVELIKKLFDKIDGRAVVEAKRAAEVAAAAPVPVVEGRVTIVGTILSTRSQEGQWGTQLKMLVKHDSGYKLWGTVPSELSDRELKGARVEFVAQVKRSDNDEKFGFFSRPTKAKFISQTPCA